MFYSHRSFIHIISLRVWIQDQFFYKALDLLKYVRGKEVKVLSVLML